MERHEDTALEPGRLLRSEQLLLVKVQKNVLGFQEERPQMRTAYGKVLPFCRCSRFDGIGVQNVANKVVVIKELLYGGI